MILLKIDCGCAAIAPLKGDAPGAVNMQGVAQWLAPQGMKIEARLIQMTGFLSCIQGVEPA